MSTLRATIAFDYPTAAEMAAHLATALFPQAAKPAAASAAPAKSATAKNGLGEMSAGDLAALLEEELKR